MNNHSYRKDNLLGSYPDMDSSNLGAETWNKIADLRAPSLNVGIKNSSTSGQAGNIRTVAVSDTREV